MDDLTPELRKALADQLLAEATDEENFNRLRFYAPYKRQREFHEAGATKRERLLMAANQSGKTFCGGMEMRCTQRGATPTTGRADASATRSTPGPAALPRRRRVT